MKPLIANPKRANEAHVWHTKVFKRYGGPKKVCTVCWLPGATDAAHVIGRPKLGKWRYSDERWGRPLHRLCHTRVDTHQIEWPLQIRQEATRAANEYLKVKLAVPVE